MYRLIRSYGYSIRGMNSTNNTNTSVKSENTVTKEISSIESLLGTNTSTVRLLLGYITQVCIYSVYICIYFNCIHINTISYYYVYTILYSLRKKECGTWRT